MNLLLDLKIAFRYSLYYTVGIIIQHVAILMMYDPADNNFNELSSSLATPLILIAFPILLVLAHRYYRKQDNCKTDFGDIVLISAFFILLTYTMNFIAQWTVYKSFIEATIVKKEGRGILDLIDAFIGTHAPTFAPLEHLVISPIYSMKYLFSFHPAQLINLFYIIIYSPIGRALIILYLEGLYLIFRKYHQPPGYAVVPILNNFILTKLADKPGWWNVFLYVPFVRWFFLYEVNKKIAADFRKDNAYALGMTLLPAIFYGPLAFHPVEPHP